MERPKPFFHTRRSKAFHIRQILDDKPDEFPHLYRGFEAKVFITRNGTTWRLHISPEAKLTPQGSVGADLFDTVDRQKETHDLLAGRQSAATEAKGEDQQEAAEFFHQNWSQLSPLFYKDIDEKGVHSEAFANVELGEMVDVVAIGSDGTVFLFDFVEHGRRDKLQRATEYVRKILPDARRVSLRVSLTNESRNPKKKILRMNVSPLPSDRGASRL